MTDKPDPSDSVRRKARIGETAAELDALARSFEKFVLSRRGLPGVDAVAMEREAAKIRVLQDRKMGPR